MFEYSFTAVIGLILASLILVKYFPNKKFSSIPIFPFPSDKRKNFFIIQKRRFDQMSNWWQWCWWHLLNVGVQRYCNTIVDAGDQNDQNCHQHLIVVTNTFRLQHRCNLSNELFEILVELCIGCMWRNFTKNVFNWWLVSDECSSSYCSYWFRTYQQSF